MSRSESQPHIINPNTPAIGGVLLVRTGIVVDSRDNPEPYEAVYDHAVDLIGDTSSALGLTAAVGRSVDEHMPWHEDAVRAVLKAEAQAQGVSRLDQSHLVGLSKFISRGGVCHHQTLLFLTMMELLQERRGVGGRASIWYEMSTERGSDKHVEARYVRDGEIIKVNFEGFASEICHLRDINNPLSYTVHRPSL